MTQNELNILLQEPHRITPEHSTPLQELVEKYPYFQSVRSLYLKSLFLQQSSTYNLELKKTAAYTLDRDILFNFICSPDFISYTPIQFTVNLDQDTETETPVLEEEPKSTSTAIQSLLQSIQYLDTDKQVSEDQITINSKTITEADPPSTSTPSTEQAQSTPDLTSTQVQNEENSTEEKERLEEKLEIGKPLNFTESEKLSFNEWLQLSKIKPIDRENTPILTESEQKIDIEKQKKIELIDKFIETNPKIVPTKKPTPIPVNIDSSVQENSSLMTETLAKIYLEQKKYQKAIQAYEILILKYPEKSSFFADQILDIKALQQHNS